ncbi:phytanoyl-CoA dioxygenase family protein [Candidatus Poribacteria bacterium]|nr:phytanoyl-CoA dioxygenase family protein [Candidatus Poribacteria bacterium]
MTLTPTERDRGSLDEERLSLVVQLVRMNGYVLLERMLPDALVRELHAAFMRSFEAYVARTDPNRGANRFQMHLPFIAPFTDPRITTHPMALQVLDALLGQDCVCHYFASDTPLPGSDYQRVHSDIHGLFTDCQPLPTYSIVMNVPLVDFTVENGAVEIWPGGSHLMPTGIDMAALAPLMHSARVLMPAGSLLIRDMRMWHRGTPNTSDHARPNLAFIYSKHWLKTHYPPISMPQDTYDGLSDRAKRLFRFENIGGTPVNLP